MAPVPVEEGVFGRETAAAVEQRELVVVSNRLPVRVGFDRGVTVEPTAGGLATALSGVGGVSAWIGWPGTEVPGHLEADVTSRLGRARPAPGLPRRSRRARVLRHDLQRHALAALPLLPRPAPDHGRGLAAVRRRERALRPGRRAECRARRAGVGPRLPPDARAGAAAAPAAPTSRSASSSTSPSRPPRSIACCRPARRSCAGSSAPTTSSFHTGDYARHFRSSCLRVLGLESEPDAIEFGGRRVGVGVDPIGIDTASFRESVASATTAHLSELLERALPGPAPRPRDRAARLHQGHPAEAPRLRALPRGRALPCPHDDDAAGARPVAARERRVPRVAGRDRAPDRTDQRPFRPAGGDAGRVHPPRARPRRAGGPVPASRRDAGHTSARRHEPGGARVRPLPGGSRPRHVLPRHPRAVGVRRRGARPARRAAREPVEHRRHGGAPERGPRLARRGAHAAPRDDRRARRHPRLQALGRRLPAPGSTGARR